MLGRLLRAIETVRSVRADTRVWVQHLTGEGATTLRRQRDAVARALGAGLQGPPRRPVFVYGGLRRRPTRRRQPILSTR